MTLAFDTQTELESLQRRSLKEEIFSVLHEKIIAGKVRAGEWLRQEDIATQLGVSMTPVREALDLLVSVGLAERVPYRGVRVPQPSAEEIIESYAMRLLLEAAGARAAALKREQAQVEDLKRILSRMKDLVSLSDMSTLRQLSRQFHRSVVAIGENSMLDRFYEMTMNAFPDWMLYEYLFRHPDLLASSLNDEYEEHMALVKAIQVSDPKQAEACARAHIYTLKDQLASFLGIETERLESKARLFGAPFAPDAPTER